MAIMKTLLSMPIVWDFVQNVLGANRFKRELYLSKLHPPGKLLDFGCADGHIADTFAGFDYYGVDIDPVAIAAAQRRFRLTRRRETGGGTTRRRSRSPAGEFAGLGVAVGFPPVPRLG